MGVCDKLLLSVKFLMDAGHLIADAAPSPEPIVRRGDREID
jgi:hypothetical protein